MFGISASVLDCLGADINAMRSPKQQPKLPKWNEGTTLKFVRLYRQHECLWNPSHPQYKDKFRRHQACEMLADKMGLPDFGPSEVPRKIKILRSTYCQELMKIERSKINGEETYVPAIKWFSIMDDILSSLPTKKQTRTSEFIMENGTLVETDQENELLRSLTEDTLTATEVIVKSEDSDDGCIEVHQIVHRDDLVPKVVDEDSQERSLRIHKKALKKRALRKRQLVKLRRREGVEDEFYIFGKHVAAQLRRLEEEECAAAQEQIQTVLSQARMRTAQRFGSPYQPVWTTVE